MKIAGGVLLIVFGAIGMIFWFFIGAIASAASSLGAAGAATADNMTDQTNAMAVSDIGNTVATYGTILGLIALVLLAMGIVVIVSKQMWPSVTALVTAVIYTFIPPMSIITGIGLILGGILAVVGAQQAAKQE
jgi:hypothetical protein